MMYNDEELQSGLDELLSLACESSEDNTVIASEFQCVKNKLFTAMSKETGIDDDEFDAASITNRMLNKDRCLFFLNCMVKLVDGSVNFVMRNSSSAFQDTESDNSSIVKLIQKENKELKDEAISDKKVIIELQEKVIVQAEKKLQEIQNTVKSEMKSFSSIVKDTCAAALAPSMIGTAIKNVKLADDSREKNIIVYGVPEEEDEDVSRTASAVFEEVGEKPHELSCSRLGSKREGSTRPIKCCLSSAAFVFQILRNAAKLKQSDRFGSVYLSPDRTVEERTKRRKLVEQFKLKKSENPDSNFRIDFRNYVIVDVNHV